MQSTIREDKDVPKKGIWKKFIYYLKKLSQVHIRIKASLVQSDSCISPDLIQHHTGSLKSRILKKKWMIEIWVEKDKESIVQGQNITSDVQTRRTWGERGSLNRGIQWFKGVKAKVRTRLLYLYVHRRETPPVVSFPITAELWPSNLRTKKHGAGVLHFANWFELTSHFLGCRLQVFFLFILSAPLMIL